MSLTGMDDAVTFRPHGVEHRSDWIDRRLCQRQVVAHLVDITALAAKIGLHVDDDQCGVFRREFAVKRPRVGVAGNSRHESLRRSVKAFPVTARWSRKAA